LMATMQAKAARFSPVIVMRQVIKGGACKPGG
jgi:hypothetical protein